MARSHWLDYEGVLVEKLDGTAAYTYRTSHIALDADGSPRAYHPDDCGLDDNRNAGFPNRGWRGVLAVDPAERSRPFVQSSGASAGYFVSKTSLRGAGPDTDPATFVDAETFPYIVFPGAFYAVAGTGRYGDLVMARAVGIGRETAGVVGDGGPAKAQLGEVSIAMAVALGGRRDPAPSPRTGAGAPAGTFEYVVFPGSASTPAWPLSFADVDRRARELLAAAGGWPA